jgi:hypothetical protein
MFETTGTGDNVHMTNNANTETVPMTQQDLDLMHALAFHIARAKVLGLTVNKEREAQFLALSNRFMGITLA